MGLFNYQADALPGIYDHSYAETGEPFFWELSDELHIDFTYWTNGVELKDFQGTYQLTAYLEDEHGWHRGLVLGEKTSFSTFPITFSGDLVLANIAAKINAYQRQTGIARNNYILVIEPLIITTGSTAGMMVQSEFSPELKFYINTSEFYLVNDDQTTLEPELTEAVTKLVEQGGTLSLFSLAVPVKVIRGVSLTLLLAALAFFGMFSNYFAKMLQRNDPDGLAFRYSDWIVDAEKMPSEEEMSFLVEFDDLIKLAAQYDLIIYHHQTKKTHFYYLKAPEGYFYYRLGE